MSVVSLFVHNGWENYSFQYWFLFWVKLKQADLSNFQGDLGSAKGTHWERGKKRSNHIAQSDLYLCQNQAKACGYFSMSIWQVLSTTMILSRNSLTFRPFPFGVNLNLQKTNSYLENQPHMHFLPEAFFQLYSLQWSLHFLDLMTISYCSCNKAHHLALYIAAIWVPAWFCIVNCSRKKSFFLILYFHTVYHNVGFCSNKSMKKKKNEGQFTLLIRQKK